MKEPSNLLLLWAPRLLTILFALFVSLFALDVFEEGLGFWQVTFGLLMHLIPTLIILLVLALAWRREWVGALAYISLAILYLVATWGRFHWSAYAAISGPLFLIGILFLMGWFFRAKGHVAP